MSELLFEVGLEEIPARMIPTAQAELAQRTQALLAREGLLAPEFSLESYSTPRRLAVRIGGVITRQPDVEETLTGPAAAIAFKNGEPTPAAHAFARKAGVTVAELARTTTPKGEYVVASVRRTGQSALAILAAQLPRELDALPWQKSMYWRAGKPERFVRPVRWLLALLDDQVVPVEFAGVLAGNKSYGHRILHGDQPIEIAHPSQYLEKLEAAYVLTDVETRRQKIRKALDAAARSVPGIRWREDHPLVDAVTHLTEWPSVLLGSFEAEYLSLPEEVLVTVMRDHQKYFALEDEIGKLAPYFLAVLNTQADEQGLAVIRHGNERVLRSRFKDARFFWDFDQRMTLEDRVELLKSVTFQKDIGSYYDKTKKDLEIAEYLSNELIRKGTTINKSALLEAVRLAKADLTTELVKEFTELQGIVGGRYAEFQGLSKIVVDAIYSQYLPASPDDPIPKSIEGQVLGLADRLNTISLMFNVGFAPTGSKDPFALRRAGNAVIRIILEAALPLSLRVLLGMPDRKLEHTVWPAAAITADDVSHAVRVHEFLEDRLRSYMEEGRGFDYDIVKATMAKGTDDVADAFARANALTTARYSDDFAAICAAFKRIKNILRQAAEKQTEPVPSRVNEALLIDQAEQTLYSESTKLAATVEELRAQQKYSEALERIATLRPHVDHFFNKVMVMAPEPAIRQNRLALIASVLQEFSKIADFSEIVTP